VTTTNKPNFFVIGASKAGTSSLCELLGNHPDVFFSTPKEPYFFTQAETLGLTESWYTSLFARATDHPAIGEGSTDYAVTGLHPGIERRIAAFAPGARIIYIVRHPLERMESQWIQLRSTGAAPSDFPTAVREIPEMIEGNLYWKNVSAYRAVFPDERILLLFFEDFRADAAAVLARCFTFLGLDPDVPLDAPERPRNSRRFKREDRRLLSALRRLPGFPALRDALFPHSWRPALKRWVTVPVEQRPRWDAASFRWAADRVAADSRQLLRHYGKPEAFWSFDAAWLSERAAAVAAEESREARGAS
jgi:hypothetical protein